MKKQKNVYICGLKMNNMNTKEKADRKKHKSCCIYDYPSVDASNIMRPITDGDYPVVDFGDFWGRINENGEPAFKVFKEQESLWLLAFVAKYMQEPENLTEFGEQYCKDFYTEYLSKNNL